MRRFFRVSSESTNHFLAFGGWVIGSGFDLWWRKEVFGRFLLFFIAYKRPDVHTYVGDSASFQAESMTAEHTSVYIPPMSLSAQVEPSKIT